MAYNNFPIGYQPAQIIYPQAPQQAPQQSTGIIWVQGEAGAKSYLVAPNQSIALWDTESQTIYVKTSDAAGIPSMRTLDYTIRENAPKQQELLAVGEFASKDDVDTLKDEIEALRADLEDVVNTKKEKK